MTMNQRRSLSEAIDRHSVAGEGFKPSSIARAILREYAETADFISDVASFIDSEIGSWAYGGLYDEVRSQITRRPENHEGQSDLFAHLPKTAYVEKDSKFKELRDMNLLDWRDAISFKKKKAAETLAEARLMQDFLDTHEADWEIYPDKTAQEISSSSDSKAA